MTHTLTTDELLRHLEARDRLWVSDRYQKTVDALLQSGQITLEGSMMSGGETLLLVKLAPKAEKTGPAHPSEGKSSPTCSDGGGGHSWGSSTGWWCRKCGGWQSGCQPGGSEHTAGDMKLAMAAYEAITGSSESSEQASEPAECGACWTFRKVGLGRRCAAGCPPGND